MNSKGFTLIELMIVVAIIIFLASVGIPKYKAYVAKAKQVEVAVNLSALHAAEQAYWAENGEYTTELGGENGIWKPEGYKNNNEVNFNYTYGFNFPGAKEGIHYFVGKLKTPKEQLGICKAEKDAFIAKAAGNIVDDKTDVWQIDESRNIKNIKKGF